MKLRPDYEKPVAAVLDVLCKHPRIHPRIGIWGRSFGGYAAPRAAAFDRRLKACVSIGGFYDMTGIWSRFPASTKETLQFGFGAGSEDEARGPTTLTIFAEGNHVCDNIPYKARPLMADWLAQHLH